MDTGRGYFEKIPEEIYKLAEKKYLNESGVFKVGEKVEIKGSTFRIKSIKPDELRLKLLRSVANKPLELTGESLANSDEPDKSEYRAL